MENNKTLFLKWIKNLFYIQCVAFVGYLIGLVPFIGSWIGWITVIVSLVTVYCLYKLIISYRRNGIAYLIGIYLALLSLQLLALQ